MQTLNCFSLICIISSPVKTLHIYTIVVNSGNLKLNRFIFLFGRATSMKTCVQIVIQGPINTFVLKKLPFHQKFKCKFCKVSGLKVFYVVVGFVFVFLKSHISLSFVLNRNSSCSKTQCNQINIKPSKSKCKTTACTLQSLFTKYFGKEKLQPS